MCFEVKNKVGIVTGGASGIGLAIVKRLLLNGAKGVVIADINVENGKKATNELQNEFGKERVIFVKTDVADSTSFENAFEVTLRHFQHIDILVNDAGVLDGKQWDVEINVNLKGAITGVILGLEKYLPKHKQSGEAVILNISSVAALMPLPAAPTYSATKCAILGLTRCWGDPYHYDRTSVRVLAICPGMTNTPIIANFTDRLLNSSYTNAIDSITAELIHTIQSADHIGVESIKIIEKAANGSVWVVENSQDAYEYTMPDRADFINKVSK